jgi:hypothetical protein
VVVNVINPIPQVVVIVINPVPQVVVNIIHKSCSTGG